MKGCTKPILIGLAVVILVTAICFALVSADKEREILIISQVTNTISTTVVTVCYTDRTVEAYWGPADYDIAEDAVEGFEKYSALKLASWEYAIVWILAEVISHSDTEQLSYERFSTELGYYRIKIKGRVIEIPQFREAKGAYSIFLWLVEPKVREAHRSGAY